MTDALGGVQVNVPTSFTSSSGIPFKAGVQTLDGVHALAFVRERYSFADGDYQRARNQQTFLKAAMSRFLTAETLTNPIRVQDLVKSTSPYISVDKSLDATTIAGLALELRDVRPANVLSFTLPNKGIGTSQDGQSIVIADTESIDAVGAAFRNGTLGSYLQSSGLALQK
jgi:anionic cell wall polymer biosynthesis LytR-Cps2A-Psr (LCP) family protein